MHLQEIIEPIRDDLDAFEKQFKNLLKSDIFLVDKVVNYLVSHKGKRLRPILVLLTASLKNDQPGIHKLNAAAIVELMHTASLLHDDVVDDSYQRRGFPSINAIWKNKIAVLTGDYLFAKVLTAMYNIRDFAAFDTICSTSQRMSQGELLQIERSKDFWMEEEVYYRLIGDKTASLISAACRLGAITGEGTEEDIKTMQEFGENIGLAFQIRDDLLDLIGTEKKTGKPIANDLRENKITLPLLHALKQAERREAKQIIRMVKRGANRKNISKIISFIERNNGIAYAGEQADHLVTKAIRLLDRYEDSKYKTVLIKLVRFITSRDH